MGCICQPSQKNVDTEELNTGSNNNQKNLSNLDYYPSQTLEIAQIKSNKPKSDIRNPTIDLRLKVNHKVGNNEIYDYQYELFMEWEEDIQAKQRAASKGSGCVIFVNDQYVVLLTCAHNLISFGENHSVKVQKIGCRQAQIIPNQNNKTSDIQLTYSNFYIYDNYFTDQSLLKGYDIVEENQIQSLKGSLVKVIGFPKQKGVLKEHEGEIDEIRFSDDHHAIIIYNQIQTTDGQSGSPVYVQITDNSWCIIGVHNGKYGEKRLNIGTAITPAIFKWMNQTIQNIIM